MVKLKLQNFIVLGIRGGREDGENKKMFAMWKRGVSDSVDNVVREKRAQEEHHL